MELLTTAKDAAEEAASTAADGVERACAEHANGERRPLLGYATLLATYLSGVLGLSLLVRRRGALTTRPSAADLALLAVATHKLARMITKDSVTADVRMPFTRFEGPAGVGEVNESVRARSQLGHAVGELLTCPFCMAQWVATGFTFGLLLAPRATRWIATVFCCVAASDFLQLAYARAEQAVE